MSMFMRLLGVQLRQRYGLSAMRASLQENRGKAIFRLLVGLLVLVGVGSVLGMYVWLLNAMMPAFESLGMSSILLGLALLLAMVFVFFMGMVYLIGLLFFSKDTEFLATLPISQRTVFAAKFTQVLLGEMITCVLLLLPAFIVYGVHTAPGALYWVRALLITLLAPCVPLALSALLSLLLMRFTALWRRRDLLTIIGSILLILVVMLGQSYLTGMLPEDMSPDMIMTLIADHSALLKTVVSAFPPAGWAAEGLLSGGGPLWLFIGVSLLALALVTLIAGRMYYRGALAQIESDKSGKAVNLDGKSLRRHSAMYALFLREWRIVLRTPVYALNGLLVIILGPIMLIMPKIMQGAGNASDFDVLFQFLEGAVDPRYILLILAGIFALMSMISPASSTTISREGKTFGLLRTWPVSPVRQIMAKFLFALSVAVLTMVFMGVTATLMFGFAWPLVLASFALGLLVCILPLSASMIPDVLHPKLSWNSETEAIKQNMNAILGMFLGWALLAALAFGAYKVIAAGLDMNLAIGLVIGASALLGAAGVAGLCLAAKRCFRTVEG